MYFPIGDFEHYRQKTLNLGLGKLGDVRADVSGHYRH